MNVGHTTAAVIFLTLIYGNAKATSKSEDIKLLSWLKF